MKNQINYLILVVLFLIYQSTYAQSEDLSTVQKNVQRIEASNVKLNAEVKALKNDLSTVNANMEVLKTQIEANAQLFQTACSDFESKVSTIETSSNSKIETLDKTVSSEKTIWILAIFVCALLSLSLFYGLLKKQAKEKAEHLERLAVAQSTIEAKDLELETKINQLIALQKKTPKE